MTGSTRFLVSVIASLGVLRAGTAQSEEGVMRDDPKRPVVNLRRDLGITPEKFKSCFANVSPAPARQHPDGERTQSLAGHHFGPQPQLPM